MGLDGFSMNNLGLYNRMTSAQMANEVDTIAARGNKNQIKDIESASKKNGIERKDSDFSDSGGQAFLGEDSGSAEEDITDAAVETPDAETIELSPNRFEIRLNQAEDIVELYDNYHDMTVQRLSLKDMLQMIKKFDNPAGLFVNKKG